MIKRLAAALCASALISGTALAQTFPGQLPALNVLGNPSGAQAPPTAFPIFSTANTWPALQTFSAGLGLSGAQSATGPYSVGPTSFLGYGNTPAGNIGGLLINVAPTGSTNVAQTQWNQLNCTDALADTGAHPANNCLAVNHVLNSTLIQGGRQAFGVVLNLSSPTSPSNSLAQYVASVGAAYATGSGDQGTNITPRGSLYASNFITTIAATAQYLYAAVGGEDDIQIQTSGGTAPTRVANRNFVAKAAHAAHGQLYDGSLVIGVEAGSVGMLNGVLFSCHFNDATCAQGPVATTGSLFATEGAWTVANGLDLSSITISTCAFKLSAQCSVSGTGALRPGSGTFATNVGQIYTSLGGGGLGLVISAAQNASGTNDLSIVNIGGTSVLAIPQGTANAVLGAGAATVTNGGGLKVGSPTGGDKGAGTLNVQGTIWTNGTQGIATTVCTVTVGNTYTFTNGLLTTKGANCT